MVDGETKTNGEIRGQDKVSGKCNKWLIFGKESTRPRKIWKTRPMNMWGYISTEHLNEYIRITFTMVDWDDTSKEELWNIDIGMKEMTTYKV